MALAEIDVKEITLTEAAANAVRDLLEKRALPEHALRVFISGGGCSGYQYGMALEADPRPTDLLIEQYGVRVVIDEVSIGYLRGSTIDFIDDVMGSGFKIENPNATSSCGCGNSFRTDDQAAGEGGGGCGHH